MFKTFCKKEPKKPAGIGEHTCRNTPWRDTFEGAQKDLESIVGPVTNEEFAQILDLATADILINRVGFGKRTSLADIAEIAKSCFIALGRGKVA